MFDFDDIFEIILRIFLILFLLIELILLTGATIHLYKRDIIKSTTKKEQIKENQVYINLLEEME